jgi:hypothetical protein
MSINPVLILDQAQFADANSRRQQPLPASTVNFGKTSSGQTNSGQPNAGTPPKQEVLTPQNALAFTELPQDEVQVQRDNWIDGEIVVKYLNPAGDVILQIPSSQLLGMARSIGQDFQKAAQARANADAPREKQGGETHGH